MKTLIIYLVLAFSAGIINAQEIIELEETRVEFTPFSPEITKNGNNFSVVVMESFKGEFVNDPLTFMDKHFDIKKFMSEVKNEDYNSYSVNFKSSKGNLVADFDKEGNHIKTSFKLKNVLVPADLREQLYRDHKGWAMVKNTHIAKGKNGKIDKEFYRIKMENGKQTKKFKIERTVAGQIELANN